MMNEKSLRDGKNGYFKLGPVLSFILAFIPITSLVCGVMTRAKNKYVFGAILNILLFPIF
jgi:hypothetical protein